MADKQNENSLIGAVSNIRLQYGCQQQDRSSTRPQIVFKRTQPEDVEKKAFLEVLVRIAVRISQDQDKEGDE
jgi:hypothetical protein